MNLLADEGVDKQVVDALRLAGHTVTWILEQVPGSSDDLIIELANSMSALLITQDKDFGEMVFRRGFVHNGVVLLRLHVLSADDKAELVCNAMRVHGTEMYKAFTVINVRNIRIRTF